MAPDSRNWFRTVANATNPAKTRPGTGSGANNGVLPRAQCLPRPKMQLSTTPSRPTWPRPIIGAAPWTWPGTGPLPSSRMGTRPHSWPGVQVNPMNTENAWSLTIIMGNIMTGHAITRNNASANVSWVEGAFRDGHRGMVGDTPIVNFELTANPGTSPLPSSRMGTRPPFLIWGPGQPDEFGRCLVVDNNNGLHYDRACHYKEQCICECQLSRRGPQRWAQGDGGGIPPL